MKGPTAGVSRAGFILAGGRSSRMGRDKALLPVEGGTLIGQIASRVLEAAGSVILIGPPERYSNLPYPVIADRVKDCGPLGGVYTALSITRSDWNLITACDMPALTVEFLKTLFETAEASRADGVIPQTARGVDPLCAVYHRRCLPIAASAVERSVLKMQDFVSLIRSEFLAAPDSAVLENINTPEQWTISQRGSDDA